MKHYPARAYCVFPVSLAYDPARPIARPPVMKRKGVVYPLASLLGVAVGVALLVSVHYHG